MASEVKTNKISPATSTTVTLGDASDTFVIPASATLDVNGTIDVTGATTTGFPTGGFLGYVEFTADGTYTAGTSGHADGTNIVIEVQAGGGGAGAAAFGECPSFAFYVPRSKTRNLRNYLYSD